MVKINEKNLLGVVEVLINYEKSMDYNSKCFSTSDIARSKNASEEFDSVLNMLVHNGINIEKKLASLDDGTLNFNNGDNFIESDKHTFELIFKLNQFEKYLQYKQMDYDWIIEDNDSLLVSKKEHYTELALGYPRWNYRLWNVDDVTLEYLKNDSKVFKNIIPIIESVEKHNTISNEAKTTMSITRIEEIRDNYSNDDVNCSTFKIQLNYPSDYSNEKITLIAQMGGFYKDVIILNHFDELTRIIPLFDKDYFSTRKYSSNLQENINKSLEQFSEYNSICTGNAQNETDTSSKEDTVFYF